MLASFTIRKTFYKTRITLTVDNERKTADALVTYDGLIMANQPLRYSDLDTPDKAERYLSKPVSEYNSWIEMLDATMRLRVKSAA